MTNMHDMPNLSLDTQASRAIAFIWHEADLLDRKDYAAWGALWDEQGHYIVPIDPAATDYASQLNYVYDDARMRGLRIERLTSGHSMSAADAAHTVRTVSRFSATTVADDRIEVRSAQLLAAYKRGVLTMFAANLTHHVRLLPDGGARLEQKVVRLINSQDALNALGFLL
jgi:3-phenylpropionate/cinnamic acid dioxygenase small subunit